MKNHLFDRFLKTKLAIFGPAIAAGMPEHWTRFRFAKALPVAGSAPEEPQVRWKTVLAPRAPPSTATSTSGAPMRNRF